MPAEAKDFVLVHGAWGGGWIWKQTANFLRAWGHRVVMPTLTGVGERSHLANFDVNLSTHIQDVVNCIKWEELEGKGITLVGHSYGGMVVSGVTEKVPPGTIDSIVYLDAAVPQDGQSMFTYLNRPADNLPLMHEVMEGAGSYLPEETRAWFVKMLTPQPMATFTEPVSLSSAREKIRVKTFIKATGNILPSKAAEEISRDPSWRYEEMPCGHDTQLVMPKETADALERAALA